MVEREAEKNNNVHKRLKRGDENELERNVPVSVYRVPVSVYRVHGDGRRKKSKTGEDGDQSQERLQ